MKNLFFFVFIKLYRFDPTKVLFLGKKLKYEVSIKNTRKVFRKTFGHLVS